MQIFAEKGYLYWHFFFFFFCKQCVRKYKDSITNNFISFEQLGLVVGVAKIRLYVDLNADIDSLRN